MLLSSAGDIRDVLPLAEVKAKFSEILDRVEHTHDRITVTRSSRRAAVLISAEELQSLEDTLELLSDPQRWRNWKSRASPSPQVTCPPPRTPSI